MRCKFYKCVTEQLDILFKSEFGDVENNRGIKLLRDIALKKADLILNKDFSRYDKAEILVNIEKDYKELIKENSKEFVTENIFKMYRGFEELVFNISKTDGSLSIEELEKKTIYEFYRYKELLTEEIRKNKTNKA